VVVGSFNISVYYEGILTQNARRVWWPVKGRFFSIVFFQLFSMKIKFPPWREVFPPDFSMWSLLAKMQELRI
jgi:hypothetical protein